MVNLYLQLITVWMPACRLRPEGPQPEGQAVGAVALAKKIIKAAKV
ncbi:MAG: hypothetical protein U9R38_01065 [Candidatus Margulisiibacteriota bacterium]|nr:hypothetical protein [Candidatus Margulisiibacteriota bacterium]